MNEIKSRLIFRKRAPGFNSIEELFYGLHPLIHSYMATEIVELPESRMNFSSVIKNIRFIRKTRAKVNHITGHVNYIALGTGSSTVLTIHDMKSALTNSKLKNILILVFLFWIPALIVKRITVISNTTKIEVGKYIPFALSKVRVIHNPVNPKLDYTPKIFNADYPSILCMGTKKNKNLETIFKAVSHTPCHLTILGHLTQNQTQLLNDYNIAYTNVFDLNYEDVITLYKNCDLLCFASTYEGFGMPIIEAQAIGRVVITSNFGSMKEVAGYGAYFVNPYDAQSITDGILRLCKDDQLRDDLLKKGLKNIKRFQPESIAKQYVEVYQDLLNT